MTPDAPQRGHHLRAVFNALRWIARTPGGWRDYERLPTKVARLHLVAFSCLMLHRAASLLLRAA